MEYNKEIKHVAVNIMDGLHCLINEYDDETLLDTSICRYMGFDVLLQILEGKLFVPRKMLFLDARESGKISMKYRFGFSSANEQHTDKTFEDKQGQINQYVNMLKKSKYLLTSCWTLDRGEDYLMWKSYTSDIGVCVHTTIRKLLESLDNEKYIIIYSPMVYGNASAKKDYLDSVFTKDHYYISEKEVRFYFVQRSELNGLDYNNASKSVIEEKILKASRKEMQDNDSTQFDQFKLFDIKKNFINFITFSPFIKRNTFPYFRKILMKQYPGIFSSANMIKSSDIQIK